MYGRRTAILEVFTDAACTELLEELHLINAGDDSQDDCGKFRGSVPSDNTWRQIIAPPIVETRWEHFMLASTVLLEYAFSVAAPVSGDFVGPGDDGEGVVLRDLSTAAASDIEATSGLWVRNNSGTTGTVRALATAA